MSPNGNPITIPPIPQETPAIKKESVIPLGVAPRLFRMAISFWRSITSIMIADEMFTEATSIIIIITKTSITFVEEKFSNSAA